MSIKKHTFLLFLTFGLFCLVFFVPRYFSNLKYDPQEDEILSIENNIKHSPLRFLTAPDFTHPGFWYLTMEIPTAIFGYSNGIFYYRLIQVSILFLFIIFLFFYFKKKINIKFLFSFFIIFLFNIYLVHITSEHRMYSLALGFGMFYSFYWYFLFLRSELISLKESMFLGLAAAFCFFTSYSTIWLIPIWPLAYLLFKRNINSLKRITIFSSTLLVSTAWFVPIFIKNATISIVSNQWAIPFNSRNIFQLFGNYFGLIPMNVFEPDEKINLIMFPFLFILLLLMVLAIFNKKQAHLKYLVFSTFLSFGFFVLTVYLTGNSLLYARTAIPIIIAFYVILADLFVSNNKLVKLLISLLFLIQISQFYIYFSPTEETNSMAYVFGKKENDINHFKDYEFVGDNCLIPVPEWNTTALMFFVGKIVKIIPTNSLYGEDVLVNTSNCSRIYILEQTTVDRDLLNKYYKSIFINKEKMESVEVYKNQELFIYKK